MKNLILVESPTKARTLDRFLKGKFDIQASMGHIRDLPKGKMGVDIEHGFEPQYVTPRDKQKIVKTLKELAKRAERIILATDPDREGEAISYHLLTVLKGEAAKSAKFDRIAFHEITEHAISEALAHPRDIDMNLVNAQLARRVLDRVVGYKLSPLLWKKIKRNLSAGRVQSIALRLIVEREREINSFKTVPYFRIFVALHNGQEDVEFEVIKINDNDVETSEKLKLYDGEYTYKKTILDTREKAEKTVSDLRPKTYEVIDIAQKDTKRAPYPPFITSSLQIEGARRLGYASRRTMSLAQKLYEEGFITYHRTDSYNLSTQFTTAARSFIEKEFGSKYLQPRTFQTKSKVAQEAHEAIHPTHIADLASVRSDVTASLGNDAAKVYELIYKRALATQMADAIFKSTKVTVKANTGNVYILEKSGSVLVFDGFLKLYGADESDELIPSFTVGQKLPFRGAKITDHMTAPPPRYNEASLIGALEKNGIGRPSTYATIVGTIQEREYVEREENRFTPTEIGTAVNDFLVKNFSNIDDIPFTAGMEDHLDEIANGELKWQPMLEEFYTPFEKELEKAEGEKRIEIPLETIGKTCPKCNQGELVIRRSRFGKFIACARFPDCDYKESFQEETNYTCPKDGGKVVLKKTRRGRTFYGCSNYPNCDFAVWNKNELLKQIKMSS